VFPRAIFEFTSEAVAPLSYETDTGRMIRPDRHFFTDGGSVPLLAESLIQRDAFLPAYLFHDSAYEHGGLFECPQGSDIFTFRPYTRAEADELLRQQILDLAGTATEARVVWLAVRLAGWVPWGKHGAARQADLRAPVPGAAAIATVG
jgi:hypothetical protein